MDSRYIVLALPVFALSILLEILLSARRPQLRYHLHDTLGSLSCGISQQVLLGFLSVGGFVVYQLVQQHASLFAISPSSPLAWVALLFLDDFCYYLYHRASHRVNFFWATHVVHHQSEEYNLSTALRQSGLTGLTSWLFYLPIALLGFPLLMWLTMHTFNILYQFWIHTRLISRLGPLEWIFNTPSHHRVHHGINPRYIDRNHAGIFILWDRLLGTFAAEDKEPVYGTVKPLASFDPIWANLSDWQRLWQMSKATSRLRDKIWVWLAPPEWRPADLGGPVTVPEIERTEQRKYDVTTPRPLNAYAVFVFVSALAGGIVFLQWNAGWPLWQRIAIAVELLWALWAWAAVVEERRGIWAIEIVRSLSLAPLGLLLPLSLKVAWLGFLVVQLAFLAAVAVPQQRAASLGK
ncbi:MAG: sterol desaturase family protein [Myxococcales bacterium]|nr:sterol desaturase family protein [Myxococcales bacterium]